jgi:hypothetical protein
MREENADILVAENVRIVGNGHWGPWPLEAFEAERLLIAQESKTAAPGIEPEVIT